MTGNEYQKLAMRTNDQKSTKRLDSEIKVNRFRIEPYDVGGILNACLGLSGEVGEFNDVIKKWIFHNKDFDYTHAKKELGDVMWYVALMCESFGWSLDEILQMNIDKLKKRYPEGFDIEKANHREENDV